MIDNKEVMTLENLELLEQSQLIMEYSYLERLKSLIRSKDPEVIERLEKAIESYESRLEELHARILTIINKYIHEDRNDYFFSSLDKIEGKIQEYQQDLKVMNEENDQIFRELIAREQWEELGDSIIEVLEQDIEEWLAMDQHLIDLEERYIRSRK